MADSDEREKLLRAQAETALLVEVPKGVNTSRFRILKQLGGGRFGVVYLAQDLDRGREVALKTLQGVRPEQIERLQLEFQTFESLRHENLALFYELFVESECLYFTTEYIRGYTILQHVRDTFGADYPRLRNALSQLASGLSVLHESGKLHRDVKPTNVLVTPEERVVLLDFGLAGELAPNLGGTRIGALDGSEYMSPEEARGESLTVASDWYSVGVLLYQALVGRSPFLGSPPELVATRRDSDVPAPKQLDSEVPEELSDLCMSLLEYEPSRRSGVRELLALTGRASTSPRPPAEQDHLLFGRQAELEKLERALARVQVGTGEGVTVLVDGNSGVGKTSLVEHFLTQPNRREATIVLRGRCYEREQVPYQGIDSLIDDLCRLLSGFDPVLAESVLPRHVSALVRLFPVLERVPAVAKRSGDTRLLGGDERETRRQAFGALRELLARIADRLSNRRAVIIHIDDLQWGDLDTAGLLRDVLRPPDAPIMLLILAYRSEDELRSPCLRVLAEEPIGTETRVHVGPLSPDAAEALVRELLPATQAALDVPRLARDAGGNPFLLWEVAHFARAGSITDAASIDIHTALRARIARLPRPALELLQTIAVAGHPLTEEVTRSATAATDSAPATWRLLVAEHLVRFSGPPGGRLVETFHDRVREVVIGSLAPQQAQACHRSLATALEQAGSVDPEVLARHHDAGGNRERALAFTVAAATQATRALAFERAARLLGHAVELADDDVAQRSMLLHSLAEALGSAGQCIDSARVYLKAAEDADPAARIQLRRHAAAQLLFAGKINEGRTLIRDDLRSQGIPIPRTPGRTLASVVLLRAFIRLRGLGFHPRNAADIPTEALAFLDHLRSVSMVMSFVDVGLGAEIGARFCLRALNLGEPNFIALGLAFLAGHSGVESPFSRRTNYLFERMGQHSAGLADTAVQGTAEAARGLRAYFSGQWRLAAQQLDSAEQTLRDRPGVVCEVWSARAISIWSRFFLGDWSELSRRVLLGLGDARDRGNAYGMAGICSPFGVAAWLARNEPNEARRTLREVTSTWSVEGFQIQHYWFLMAESLIQLYEGDGPGAWAQIRARWSSAAASLTMRFPMNKAQLLHMRGCCALAAAEQARNEEKRSLVKEAEAAARRLRRVKLPLASPLANLLYAGAAAQQGQRREASEHLEAAILELTGQEMLVYAAAARRRLARLRGHTSAEFLPGQTIVDPDAITRMLVPGCAIATETSSALV